MNVPESGSHTKQSVPAEERGPLSLAKTSRPRLPTICHRERLYEILDLSREYPLVWVMGPAGSGKTTLVSGYLTSRKAPCLWYQMDQGDGDLPTFFHYMGLAAESASAKPSDPLPTFSPEYPVDISIFALRYFESLCARLKAESTIVLDNYHEVPPNSPLHKVICHAPLAMPQGLSLIIVSRKAPHAAFSRLRANRLMTSIGWDKIRLTKMETGEIASLQSRETLSDQAIARLHRVTEGWVAGLILMLLSNDTEKERAQRIDKRRRNEIFDYIAGEVFETIDIPTRDLLCKTALFPHMTCRMAETLTGLTNADRVFSTLYRNHLFVEKYSREEILYQYHPLFREFLLNHFDGIYSEEERRSMRHNAAMLLEDDGQIEAAISLYHNSGYGEEALPLIMRHAPSLLSQGRTQPLLKWLRQLPNDVLDRHPWLTYWMGACHLSIDPIVSRTYYERAFELFEAQGDRGGLLWTWSGIVQSVFYAFDGFPVLDWWIEVLEEQLEQDPDFPSEEIEARVVFGMLSALVFRQPHHPHMEYWADRAMRLADATRDARGKAYAYTQLIFYHMMMGCHGKGLAVVEAAERLADAAQTDPLVRIDMLAVRACYYQNVQHYPKCLDVIHEGLEFSAKSGVHVLDVMFLGWGAWIAIAANDRKTAVDLIERLASSQGRLRAHENSFYHFLRSQEAIISGQFHKAHQHADLSLKILKKLGIPINICIVRLSKAQALHGLGRTVEAQRQVGEALRAAKQMGSSMLQFSALLLKAKMATDDGEEEFALVSIRDAMHLGKTNKYCISMVGQSSDLMKVCALALEAGIEVDYVQDVIRRRGFIPEEPDLVSEDWPWPIKIMTLGGFELFIDGKPFSSLRRGPQKTLSLLKALVALGGKGVSEARIQDALWPDMEGDFAHNIFSTTLHRLRKILGRQEAIRVSQAAISLDAGHCWVDARHFSKMLEEADKAWEMGNDGAEKAVQFMNKAMATYKGGFLPGDDEHWTIPLRERLSSDFIRCVKKLGKYYETRDQLEEAIHCYDSGLMVDPLIEDFYGCLISCYCSTGKPAEAKMTFIRCRETFSKVLGVEPSKETQAIYRDLVQRRSR